MSYEYRIEVSSARGVKKAVADLLNGKMSTPEYMVEIEGDSKVYIALHVKDAENRILFSKIIDKLLGCGDGITVVEP